MFNEIMEGLSWVGVAGLLYMACQQASIIIRSEMKKREPPSGTVYRLDRK